MNGVEDSDGNCISVLEELVGDKVPKRTFFQKYFCCCYERKVRFK